VPIPTTYNALNNDDGALENGDVYDFIVNLLADLKFKVCNFFEQLDFKLWFTKTVLSIITVEAI
jgi:hypothetical protein